MDLNLGQWIILGVCAILIAAYIGGYFYNRQMGRRSVAWLVEGLKPWGRVAAGDKLPGMVTGGRLVVEPAGAPFKKIEALYLLAPRENPLFWLFYRLQGKRDELIVWVTYASKPKQALEVARRGDRQFTSAVNPKDKPALKLVEAPHGLQMAVEAELDAPPAPLAEFVHRYRTCLLRLSLREVKPHLFLRADLRSVQGNSAAVFFDTLSQLHKEQ